MKNLLGVGKSPRSVDHKTSLVCSSSFGAFADDWSVHVHGRIRVVVVSGMHTHVLCADAPLRFVLKGGAYECAAITTNEKKGGLWAWLWDSGV